MRPVLWTPSAENDLINIADYIAERSVPAALKLTRQIRQSVLPLSNFPYLFRKSEKMSGCREVVVHHNYLVFYRVTETYIEVVGVAHGRRQFPLR